MKFDPTQLLREKRVQVTAQRLAILRAVHARPHCSADNIIETVRAEIGTISRQAVYDALRTLTEKQLIRRIQPTSSSALYEIRGSDHHDHAICRKCGVAVDVQCGEGRTSCLLSATSSGFRIEEAEVIYWGTCPHCLEEAPI